MNMLLNIRLDFGISHCGAVCEPLVAEIELSDDEVKRIKTLVKAYQGDAEKCGLLPILEEGDTALYEKVDEAVYGVVYDFFVLNGLRNGYFDLDSQMEANYQRDKENGIVDDYDFWYSFERQKMQQDLGYFFSRYDIEGQLEMGDEEYYCKIPEFAKE